MVSQKERDARARVACGIKYLEKLGYQGWWCWVTRRPNFAVNNPRADFFACVGLGPKYRRFGAALLGFTKAADRERAVALGLIATDKDDAALLSALWRGAAQYYKEKERARLEADGWVVDEDLTIQGKTGKKRT